MSAEHCLRQSSSENGPDWYVSQCPCGQLAIHFGAVRIEFSREEFSRLHALIQHAMAEFQVAPAAHRILRTNATPH